MDLSTVRFPSQISLLFWVIYYFITYKPIYICISISVGFSRFLIKFRCPRFDILLMTFCFSIILFADSAASVGRSGFYFCFRLYTKSPGGTRRGIPRERSRSPQFLGISHKTRARAHRQITIFIHALLPICI